MSDYSEYLRTITSDRLIDFHADAIRNAENAKTDFARKQFEEDRVGIDAELLRRLSACRIPATGTRRT